MCPQKHLSESEIWNLGNLLSFDLVVFLGWQVASSQHNNTGHIQKRETLNSVVSCTVFETDTESLREIMDHSLEHHRSYIGRPISALPTPSLVVSLPVLEKNIAALHKDVEELGIGFRPHVKTLKVTKFYS